MKSQESIKKNWLTSAISSGIINFINQPAVIITKHLNIVEANQSFYDFFSLPVSVKDIKSLCRHSSLSFQSDSYSSIKLNYKFKIIEAILFNTSNEDEYLILVDNNSTVSKDNLLTLNNGVSENLDDHLYLLEQISDFCYIKLDLIENTIHFSEQLSQLLDLNDDSNLKTIFDFFTFLHPNDQAKAKNNYSQCKKGTSCEEFEVRLVTAEKRLRFITLKFNLIKSGRSSLLIVYDNSSQKMLELALRDNEALFRSIFEQAAVGIAQVSPKGELLMFNQKLCDILGYEREQLMAVNYLKLTFSEDVNKDVEVMNDMFSNSIDECIYEKRFLHKTGKPIWTKVHITVMRNEQKFPRYAVGIIDDISERKQAEQQIIMQNEDLMRLNSEMDNFVYRTSHDLRAPLASILGLVELLKAENNASQKDNYMGMIEKSIRRLDNSIHEILDLSRNSRMDFEFKNISVSNLIKNILSDLAHIKGSQNIDISTEINGTDFYCDEKRLKMIFNNLISNAVIYHNPYIDNPFIRIVAEINNEMAHFVINDNGVGIDKNHVQNIFKMFYRANDTTTGSGLGLYIVKEAVEKLKGSIEVESKIGEGTRFEIKIPNKKMNLKA